MTTPTELESALAAEYSGAERPPPRCVRVSGEAAAHVVSVYGNFNRGVNLLIRIDRGITAEQRAAMVRRYGSVSKGLREAIWNLYGAGDVTEN